MNNNSTNTICGQDFTECFNILADLIEQARELKEKAEATKSEGSKR